ncbi:hypothetical protein BD414DRAFT_506880 [Trametes punicea]|nr:hypothetical protein BD414DRAFT_506880 [Trametes punicea]
MAAKTSIRSPFDDADANIILRSADGADFHLYKEVLAKASPVFAGMFSLPSTPEQATSPQVVTLTESADTLEILLRLCYPVERPAVRNLEQLRAALEAAKKYETTALFSYLEQELKALLGTAATPLRVYSVAYLYSLRDVCRSSAKLLLSNPQYLEPKIMPPEFRMLPASALFALTQYRRECVRVARAVVMNFDWMVFGTHAKQTKALKKHSGKPVDSWAWLSCSMSYHSWATITAGGKELTMTKWMATYIVNALDALEARPEGAAITSLSVVTPALEGARSCRGVCGVTGWKDLLEYTILLEERIDKAVSQVQISLPF